MLCCAAGKFQAAFGDVHEVCEQLLRLMLRSTRYSAPFPAVRIVYIALLAWFPNNNYYSWDTVLFYVKLLCILNWVEVSVARFHKNRMKICSQQDRVSVSILF